MRYKYNTGCMRYKYNTMKNKKKLSSSASRTCIPSLPPSPPPPPSPSTEAEQESIIKELLRLACDTSVLDKKTLLERIEKILEVRLKNELMINSSLGVGMVHDEIAVTEAAQINNRNKDSISDLVKVIELLSGRATENIKITDEERLARVNRIKMMGRGLD